jgi:hypothetical protein
LYTPVIFPFACPIESWTVSPSASSKLQWATGFVVWAETVQAKRRMKSEHAGKNPGWLHRNVVDMIERRIGRAKFTDVDYDD